MPNRLVCISASRNPTLCTLMHLLHNRKVLEYVEDFTCLVSIISNDNGVKKIQQDSHQLDSVQSGDLNSTA